MSTHREEHEELVRQVLCGERTTEDAAVAELREECAECREELARLLALGAGMAALGRAQREDLARAHAEAGAGEEERVRRSFEAAVPRPRASTSAWRRALAWSAVAAALLLGFLLARGRPVAPEPAHQGELLLGGEGGTIHCLAPVGAHARYDEFSWEDVPVSFRTFHLTICSLKIRPDGTPAPGDIVTTVDVDEPRWTPPAGTVFPASIWWSVEAVDVEARPTELRGWATASL